MTASKPKADKAAPSTEFVGSYDEAQAKGYWGSVPDPLPNSAYSLESGPDAPALVDVNVDIANARSTAQAEQATDTTKEA